MLAKGKGFFGQNLSMRYKEVSEVSVIHHFPSTARSWWRLGDQYECDTECEIMKQSSYLIVSNSVNMSMK